MPGKLVGLLDVNFGTGLPTDIVGIAIVVMAI
jgi:hypothetical protein